MEKGEVEIGSLGLVHWLNSLYFYQQYKFFYLQKRKSVGGIPAVGPPLWIHHWIMI